MVENEADHSVVITQGQAGCQIVGSNVQDDYSLVAEVSGDTPLSASSKDKVGEEDMVRPTTATRKKRGHGNIMCGTQCIIEHNVRLKGKKRKWGNTMYRVHSIIVHKITSTTAPCFAAMFLRSLHEPLSMLESVWVYRSPVVIIRRLFFVLFPI